MRDFDFDEIRREENSFDLISFSVFLLLAARRMLCVPQSERLPRTHCQNIIFAFYYYCYCGGGGGDVGSCGFYSSIIINCIFGVLIFIRLYLFGLTHCTLLTVCLRGPRTPPGFHGPRFLFDQNSIFAFNNK